MKLIVALDGPLKEAKYLYDKWKERGITIWKVGHQWLSQTKDLPEGNIFLDVKLWDTPDTVRQAIKNYGAQNLYSISLRSYIPIDTLEPGSMKLWLITALSSEAPDLPINVGDGLISTVIFPIIPTIVPGIRLPWQTPDNHLRPITPGNAHKLGASYIILGRTLIDPWWDRGVEKILKGDMGDIP